MYKIMDTSMISSCKRLGHCDRYNPNVVYAVAGAVMYWLARRTFV